MRYLNYKVEVIFLLFCVYIIYNKYYYYRKSYDLNERNFIKLNSYNVFKRGNSSFICNFTSSINNYEKNIPIFVIARDRLYALEILMKGLLRLKRYNRNIVIYLLDHFTTYKPTIKYINDLIKKNNIKYIRLNTSNWYKMINKEVPAIIRNITLNKLKCEFYIITDSDICLDYVPNDIISFYIYILKNCKGIDVIGSSIVVGNLPKHYPLSDSFFREQNILISNTHYEIIWNKLFYSIVRSGIDTTFQMRRSTNKFQRKIGIMFRSLPPYSILHTDWYINPSNIPTSFLYYINRSRRINHSSWINNIKNSE